MQQGTTMDKHKSYPTREKKTAISDLERIVFTYTGWWFQPIWKILVKLEIFPK